MFFQKIFLTLVWTSAQSEKYLVWGSSNFQASLVLLYLLLISTRKHHFLIRLN